MLSLSGLSAGRASACCEGSTLDAAGGSGARTTGLGGGAVTEDDDPAGADDACDACDPGEWLTGISSGARRRITVPGAA